MGLFDKGKKRRDDFDSPVEQVDLNAAGLTSVSTNLDEDRLDAQALAAGTGLGSTQIGHSVSPNHERTRSNSVVPPVATQSAAGAPAKVKPAYGIEDAIALMRTLPSENVELVVQVVKHTLQSTRIDIATIIEDASSKQSRIETRIKSLRDEIIDLESQIASRRQDIEGMETDHKETTMVKERLVLAEKLTAKPEAKSAPVAADIKSALTASTAETKNGADAKSDGKPEARVEAKTDGKAEGRVAEPPPPPGAGANSSGESAKNHASHTVVKK